MSFKEFSAIQDALGKDKPVEKPKEAPAGDEPAAQPDNVPVEAPATKP